MSRTLVQPGKTIDAVAGSGGVDSGDVVVVGNLIGVAETDAAEGEGYALTLVGVHVLPKATGAINVGAEVWWDADNSNVANASAEGLYLLGCAVEAAGSGDTSVRVRLNGVSVTAVPGS